MIYSHLQILQKKILYFIPLVNVHTHCLPWWCTDPEWPVPRPVSYWTLARGSHPRSGWWSGQNLSMCPLKKKAALKKIKFNLKIVFINNNISTCTLLHSTEYWKFNVTRKSLYTMYTVHVLSDIPGNCLL